MISIVYVLLCKHFSFLCVFVWTNLQRGRQYAEAVQAVVELRVGGPSQEGLPELGLIFALRPAAERTHPALLAGPEQVAQGRALAAAFAQPGRQHSRAVNDDLKPSYTLKIWSKRAVRQLSYHWRTAAHTHTSTRVRCRIMTPISHREIINDDKVLLALSCQPRGFFSTHFYFLPTKLKETWRDDYSYTSLLDVFVSPALIYYFSLSLSCLDTAGLTLATGAPHRLISLIRRLFDSSVCVCVWDFKRRWFKWKCVCLRAFFISGTRTDVNVFTSNGKNLFFFFFFIFRSLVAVIQCEPHFFLPALT